MYEYLMEAELEEVLGYEKNSMKEKETTNRRNGYRERDLLTKDGQIRRLRVPRARQKFYPSILERYSRKEAMLDELIKQLYSSNVSTRDITKIYGNIFDGKLSNIY